jgi:MFS family permease
LRVSRSPFYGWRIVSVLAVTETVSWGVLYYAFAVVQVPMRAELGFSTASTAGAFSLAVLVAGVAAVPVGRWLDRHGPRALMTVGSVAAVGLVVAWSQVRTTAGLYLVFAGIGLVSATVLYDPAFAVVVRWFVAGRARALLAVTVVAGFASTVFLPLTDALIRAVGWRDALLVLAALLAVTTVLPHAIVLRRDPADLGLHPDGSDLARAIPEASGQRSGLRVTASAALRDPLFRRLTLGFAANALAVVVVVVHLVPFLREHGHSGAFAAAATGSLGALSVTGRLVVTGAVRRWPTASVTSVAFAAQAAGVAVLLVAGSTVTGAVTFVVLFGLGFGVGTIARPALLADGFGSRDYATLAAISGVAMTAARTVGPFAAGLARTSTGSYAPVLVALGVTAALSAVAVAGAGRLVAGHGDPSTTRGGERDGRLLRRPGLRHRLLLSRSAQPAAASTGRPSAPAPAAARHRTFT